MYLSQKKTPLIVQKNAYVRVSVSEMIEMGFDFHVRNKRFEVEEEEGAGTDILEEEDEQLVALP